MMINGCNNMNSCMQSCMNCCMNCCKNCCSGNIQNQPPVTGDVSGNWGILNWDINYNIDPDNIYDDSFSVKITLLGFNIVDTVIDANNPTFDINLSVSGVGIQAILGIDFANRILYLKGHLNFVFYQQNFNITLFKF
ncbi:hypothetical protein Z959_09860 [Clostridium novyi B str. ATCC 27606]|uniref:Uncharacterized protein n=2 Tax=Clostridium TaxID=1485 RepID=A0AA40IUI0_CLONO|nr:MULTISPECIES: hypothetical protein [Clostridium]KEI12533.1 hypothetical protein Z958_06370 [Clostridium novyi B str. NCTC 9691]KEI16390.1 hypothetical protein Z959_09860 [Clostridium novyi B str. ATCC 27606]KEI18546.1 hypothetical protein Z960_02675 [Clostridium haemolyticum NCTC 9693]KGN04568.1 hypothetical protein Z961_02220 [Clostridium haemolyticum NCTC 8350]OOB76266.1 hypothetical protein AXF41_03655 [Clostridium haemolyticum]